MAGGFSSGSAPAFSRASSNWQKAPVTAVPIDDAAWVWEGRGWSKARGRVYRAGRVGAGISAFWRGRRGSGSREGNSIPTFWRAPVGSLGSLPMPKRV